MSESEIEWKTQVAGACEPWRAGGKSRVAEGGGGGDVTWKAPREGHQKVRDTRLQNFFVQIIVLYMELVSLVGQV